jgi:YHYH protein
MIRSTSLSPHAALRAFAFILLFAGCGSAGTTSQSSSTSTTTTNTGLDLTQLPLGDGKVSTSPQVGYVDSCVTSFNGGGASTVGPWVNTAAGTYNFTAKTVVQGSVTWPAAAFTIALNAAGTLRNVTTNDLPNHPTGTFPIATTDPAHAYDGNPNHIGAQSLVYALPEMPTAGSSPTCLPLGAIGITLSGSVLYNALDAVGRDAVAHEEQDLCQGHPDQSSAYHYHSLTNCLADPGTGHSNLLGYALDGFGIYGVRGENGQVLTNADLDACHGHTHAITWDGKTVVMYHYHATYEYPYTIGCFNGTPSKAMFILGELQPHTHLHPDHSRPTQNP